MDISTVTRSFPCSADSSSGIRVNPKECKVFIHLFNLFTNHQDYTKHMEETYTHTRQWRQGFGQEYCRLCKIWQGHSCLKKTNPAACKIRASVRKKKKHVTQIFSHLEALGSYKLVEIIDDTKKKEKKRVPTLSDSSHCWEHPKAVLGTQGGQCLRCIQLVLQR